MAYSSIITTLGAAKLAAAMASGEPVTFSTMRVGDGNGNDIPDPLDADSTALVREVYSGAINSIEQDPETPNHFIIEMIVPAEVGGWTVREVGVFDSEGDMLVYSSFPPSYKPIVEEGAAREMLIRVIVAVANADTISLSVNQSLVVATRDWVVENFSIATLIPGGTTHQLLSKRSNSDGDYEWVDPDVATAIVEVIEENQTLSASQTIVNLAVAGTDNAAVYINGIRLREDEWTANTGTQLTLGSAASGGEKVTIVQNDPTAGTGFLRIDRRLGEIEDAGAGAQLEARQHLGITEPASLLQQVLNLLVPIGEIYITRRPGAPNTWSGAWSGFGTWERYGSGRTMVSLDPSDTDFNTLDKIGGAKTHKLLLSELPQHSHSTGAVTISTSRHDGHSHSVSAQRTGSGSPHRHAYGHNDGQNRTATTSGAGADWRDGPAGGTREFTDAESSHDHLVPAHSTNNAGAHVHTVTVPGLLTSNVGNDLAHNNLQPFIVVSVWRRIA